MVQPVAESGQIYEGDGEGTLDVLEGFYVLTAVNSYLVAGWANLALSSNQLFVCTDGDTVLIEVPAGITELHIRGGGESTIGWLRRLQP
jgi:hypothetical protein